jgi:hypothetical protein
MTAITRAEREDLVCERSRGGSARDCGCRIPLDQGGGWHECPAAMRGVLTPREALRPPRQAQPPAAPVMITGEFCYDPACGGLMIRTGSCMTCSLCGTSSGGCS